MHGRLSLMLVLQKIGTSCKASSNIRDFPLDAHSVVLMCSVGKTAGGNAKCVRFAPAPWLLGNQTVPNVGNSADVLDVQNEPVTRVEQSDEWHTTHLKWSFCQHHSPASGLDYHDVLVVSSVCPIPASRHHAESHDPGPIHGH